MTQRKEPKKVTMADVTSEKDLTKMVRSLLSTSGWLTVHFHDSRRQVQPGVFVGDNSAKGFPDIVALRGKRLLVAELKSQTGKLRKEQPAWLDAFSEAGAEVYLWRPDHWFNRTIEKIVTPQQAPKITAKNKVETGAWISKPAPDETDTINNRQQ